MNKQIKEGWHRVFAALMAGDAVTADRERERVEHMAAVQRARRIVKHALLGAGLL